MAPTTLHVDINPHHSDKMADFNSLLSKHLSGAFGSLQSRYSSTPQPKTLPLNQSPTFSNPYKFNQETLQWSPLALPCAPASQIEAEKTICILSWDISTLFTSGDPGMFSKAMETLKSLLPASAMMTVVLLRNVPVLLLPGILGHPLVRRTFLISDVNPLSWPGLGPGKAAESGTVVLVDRASENLLQAVFRVRTAFGEKGEGGEDVCFVDIRMRGGVVGRVGVLTGMRGPEAAREWQRADGVKWGVLVTAEGLSMGAELVNSLGGVCWSGGCEAIATGEPVGEYGLLRTQFKITV